MSISGTFPSVSVIIPIYNGVDDLPGLEACLLAQGFSPRRVEYLLIDNNSQDTTWAYLEAFSHRAKAQGLQVTPLSEATIQSSYAARNRGIQVASGEILVFTDADCRPEPDWLCRMVMPFQQPQIGLVVGEIKALPGHSLLEKYAERRDMLSQKFTVAHHFRPYGQTANLAIRRTALERTGLFRPRLTTGGDADLCWRVQMESDWQLHFAGDAIVRHRHRATFKTLHDQWQRYGRSNAFLHDLYGVPLQPTLNSVQTSRRLLRWMLKEVPVSGWRSLRKQAPAVDIIGTPLDLFCRQARDKGQREAQLSEQARVIEWLSQ